MRIRQLRNKIADKVILITTAVAVVFLLLSGLVLVEGHFAVSKDWSLFLLFSIGYIVIVTQGCYSVIKKQKDKLQKIVQLIFIELVVVAFFCMMFFYNIIPFPQRNMWPWGIATIVIAYITIITYLKLLIKEDIN